MATGLIGQPAIPTPRALDLRLVQQAIDNIRMRFAADEAQIALALKLLSSNVDAQAIALLQGQVAKLTLQVEILNTSAEVAELAELLASGANGIVVLKNGQLITRVLEPGVGVFIRNPDGSEGDPIIAAATVDPFGMPAGGGEDEVWAFESGGLDEGVE